MLTHIAIIHWRDATSHDVWAELDDCKNVMGAVECVSVGILLSEDDSEVKLLRSVHLSAEQAEGMFVIPKGMVSHIERIPITSVCLVQ